MQIEHIITTILFVLLQIGDAWTTRWIIKRGGIETNGALNFVASFLTQFTNAKWAWLLVAKIVPIICWFYVLLSMPNNIVYLYPLLPWYLAVVIHNDMERRGHKGILNKQFWKD